jgi:hypothetical protein
MTLSYHKVVVWLCLHVVGPNDSLERRPTGNSMVDRQKRLLWAVRSELMLGDANV